MVADAVLSRELKSLHDEVTAAHRRRLSQAADQTAAEEKSAPPGPTQTEPAAVENASTDELRELVDAIKEFAQDAEKNISAHPTATAIGALIVGLLIGRLLSRH